MFRDGQFLTDAEKAEFLRRFNEENAEESDNNDNDEDDVVEDEDHDASAEELTMRAVTDNALREFESAENRSADAQAENEVGLSPVDTTGPTQAVDAAPRQSHTSPSPQLQTRYVAPMQQSSLKTFLRAKPVAAVDTRSADEQEASADGELELQHDPSEVQQPADTAEPSCSPVLDDTSPAHEQPAGKKKRAAAKGNMLFRMQLEEEERRFRQEKVCALQW